MKNITELRDWHQLEADRNGGNEFTAGRIHLDAVRILGTVRELPRLDDYEVTVVNTHLEFKFCLSHKPSGRRTEWADYATAASLDGVVVMSQYYVGTDLEFKPMHLHDAIKFLAVTGEQTTQREGNEP